METKILLIIIGMSIVTQLPRIVPLVVLSKLNLPPLLLKWLRYIPAAVLAALLFPALLMPDGVLLLSLENKTLLASIPCIAVAVKTRNLFLTVIVGISAMFLLQLLL